MLYKITHGRDIPLPRRAAIVAHERAAAALNELQRRLAHADLAKKLTTSELIEIARLGLAADAISGGADNRQSEPRKRENYVIRGGHVIGCGPDIRTVQADDAAVAGE